MTGTIGRYRILAPLGRGAMGVVYLAEDPALNRKVAIKSVDFSIEDGTQREFLLERLLRDAKAAAMLSHPNIVSVHDIIEEADTAYLVMEYLAGESLAEYLQKNPGFDSAFTLRCLRQMAAALDYTHAKGVVHRDIKPGNVMVVADGTIKILDFGIARLSDARTTTPTGMVMGTVEYMSPEQIRGETLDGRSDQFSMAAVAYRMMTGSTLFGQSELATLVYKTVHETAIPASARNATLPSEADAVLTRALAKSPSDRFSTCDEFVATLERAFAGRVLGATALPDRKPSFYPLMAACIGIVILSAGALMVWKPWDRSAIMLQPSAKPPDKPLDQPPELASNRPPEPKIDRRVAASKHLSKELVKTKPVPVTPEKPEKTGTDKERLLPFEVYRRGQEQMKAGDYRDALASFTLALSRDTNSARAYYSRGTAQQQLGDNEAAIKDYSEAVRLAPLDALSYLGRGVCLVRMHQDDKALVDFNRALELRPDLSPALNGRGGIFLRHRHYESAMGDFDAAIRLNPKFAQAYENRARAKRALGDDSGAEADLKLEDALKKVKN